MAPLVAAVLGSVIRSAILTAAGAGVATSNTVQLGTDVSDDAQALGSAIAALITLAWGMWQKRNTPKAPVEERSVNG